MKNGGSGRTRETVSEVGVAVAAVLGVEEVELEGATLDAVVAGVEDILSRVGVLLTALLSRVGVLPTAQLSRIGVFWTALLLPSLWRQIATKMKSLPPLS